MDLKLVYTANLFILKLIDKLSEKNHVFPLSFWWQAGHFISLIFTYIHTHTCWAVCSAFRHLRMESLKGSSYSLKKGSKREVKGKRMYCPGCPNGLISLLPAQHHFPSTTLFLTMNYL